MHDVFQPRHDPARSIYNAFQDEASRRKGRTVEEWTAAEREAVFNASVRQARMMKLRAPSMEEVVRAEQYARGSIDYGAKWAYGVAEVMVMPPVKSNHD